jgi:hypothetical protein
MNEKRVLPNYVDKKLQLCKMSKLHVFVITNICNQMFATFGRIGTWSINSAHDEMEVGFALSEGRRVAWRYNRAARTNIEMRFLSRTEISGHLETKQRNILLRDSNSRPLAPQAETIPLDQRPKHV